MSFILDALKKSDDSREQAQVPNLQTIHEPPPPKKKSRRAIWPYLLVAALLVNAAALVWWAGTEEEAVAGKPAVVAPAPAPQEPSPESASSALPEGTEVPAVPLPKPRRVESAAVTAAVTKTAPGSSQVQAHRPPAAEPVRSEAAAPTGDGLHEWDDLPPRVRSSVPELALSVHFYTDAPAQRLARINDRILRQGQSVAEGVVLEEIVSEGVILSSQGYRFLVSKPRSDTEP